MNAHAAKLVRERDGIALRDTTLHATELASRKALAALLKVPSRPNEIRRSAPKTLAVHRRNGARPLIVTIARVPDNDSPIRLLVRVREEAGPTLPDEKELQDQFSLTNAEARLAIALASGQSLRDYADVTGLTAHTVRSYMARVREKMKVHRQVDVVRLIYGNNPE
nr:LuxR C-terminal-related transcriptional regulator [Acuticoccus kalidii]